MRTEQEMYDLILGVAERDARVRAVYLNGSRANPNAKKDIFQDYDAVYVVTETASFIRDEAWINVFGDILVMQQPDKLDEAFGKDVDFQAHYAYLMQFADGNRIDLTLQSIEQMQREYGSDGLTVELLDKDGILKPLPAPTDAEHWVKRPSREEYTACCNEFFWVAPYCAKGLWRGELLYAAEMLFHYVLEELKKMLAWHAGLETDFCVSMGKAEKLLSEYLPGEAWERLTRVLCAGSIESAWGALFAAYELFMECAQKVGEALGCPYDAREGENSLLYARRVKALAPDATEIF
ncbi:MAG: aminoglycoside 6-adenylyltransferase [Clostridiaceae bacterium]|nr:aminoglycoside 6-adenylyltransferase [Eubacteriales bacterium]